MVESAKRHEENSNIIKEIRASTDAAIRNQGASIKTLEIQIGQMSKVLQERGFRSLPSSTETNLRDQGIQHRSIFSETVPFPRRLQNFGCDDLREAQDVKILDAYDYTLPQKEKDSGSFTLPCFIHNICFDKAFVDLGEWEYDSEEEDVPQAKIEKKTVKPSFAKINFVKSTKQVKSPRNTSVDKSRQNTPSPRGNKRNWNQQMSQKLGNDFEMFNKACHVCGSFYHLKNDCHNWNNNERFAKQVWTNIQRVNK
ncbi:hypothetical protein Tco_0407779 [Tanacetum coccineum]